MKLGTSIKHDQTICREINNSRSIYIFCGIIPLCNFPYRNRVRSITLIPFEIISQNLVGWSGGAKVLSKLAVPGRPTNLEYSRARAYCACSRCGWGLFGHFFSPLSLLFSFSLSLGDGLI